MEDLEIKNKIESALTEVLDRDKYLLQNDIHERTVAHKLATYLQCRFPDFNVDFEYNGDILRDDKKKHIDILKEDLQKLGLLSKKEELKDKIIIERLVYPDIIIHKRGSTKDNLCIIEIKKSTSTALDEYDKLKLKCYTSREAAKDLKYQLGVFIKFCIDVNEPLYALNCYKNGDRFYATSSKAVKKRR
jgi:hypothetical protein